jgi:hypothetical protein
MPFRGYAAFFKLQELDTLAAAFEATWQELTHSGVDLSSSEEKVASLKAKLTDLLRLPFARGLFLRRTPGPLWSSAPP